MVRFVFVALLASCAHGVTESNPPGPPSPREGAAYVGRIVLETDELRDEVDTYEDAWTRRLSILGATANITYDDNRGVIDLYGTVDIDHAARVLADPGSYYMDSARVISGHAMQWLPPVDGCNCSGRLRLVFDERSMCATTNGSHMIMRNGLLAEVRTVKYWLAANGRYVDAPAPGFSCSAENHRIHHLLVFLPPGGSKQLNTDIVLALGGGSLPEIPRIASITRGVR